jgi:hypothetical protein
MLSIKSKPSRLLKPQYLKYLLLALGPILIYIFLILRYVVDFPLQDDFDSPVYSTLQYLTFDNIFLKVNSIIDFHSDHRLVFLRAISIFQIELFDTLNFRVTL